MEHSIRLFGDRCRPVNSEEDSCFQDLEMATFETPLHLMYARSWGEDGGGEANIMRIVKAGVLPQNVKMRVTCPSCNSVLEITKKDTTSHSHPRSSYLTCVCAFCEHDIFLDYNFFEHQRERGHQ